MNRTIFLLFVTCGSAQAGNYAACILDSMPGVANDPAAFSTMQACQKDYPGGMASVPQGSGRGWFEFDNGAECAAKKAHDTPSAKAGMMIRYACNRLYDAPNHFDQFDPKTATPAK